MKKSLDKMAGRLGMSSLCWDGGRLDYSILYLNLSHIHILSVSIQEIKTSLKWYKGTTNLLGYYLNCFDQVEPFLAAFYSLHD
jgi:hypothetical protein